jgi:hypothetical protein
VFHFAGIRGALKHHVLEKMREPAPSARLEAKTDLVVNANGDDRSAAVGRCDHSQTICEGGVFYGDVQMLQRPPPSSADFRLLNIFES